MPEPLYWYKNIRRAKIETDRDVLFELVNTTHAKDNTHCPHLKRWGEDESAIGVRKDIEYIWVYLEDGGPTYPPLTEKKKKEEQKDMRAILGCICIVVDDAGNTTISLLTVHEDHQGKGIASKLMDFAETFGRKTEVMVYEHLPKVHDFYIKRGYEVVESQTLTTWLRPHDIPIPECKAHVLRKVHNVIKSWRREENEE